MKRPSRNVPSPESTLSTADLQDIARELAEVAGLIEDEGLRAKLDAVRDRFDKAPAPARTPTVQLAPREVDVLAQVALGHSNQEVADNLGLLPNTV